MNKYILLLSLVFLFFYKSNGQTFQEISQNLNITVFNGYDPLSSGGVSFADFDMDGWDDLTFATGNGKPLQFYRNNQDGTFSPQVININEENKARGILWADFDNDGDRDLLVCNEGTSNHLYENTGNLNLINITEDAGLPTNLVDNTFGASFCDINNDGYLDIYIMNRTGQYANQMFLNNKNKTFTNVSFSAGTHDSLRLSFASSFFDMNMDGWQDFHISQDKLYMRNSTYKNNKDGTFSDVSVSSNSNAYVEAMAATVGDYDMDGDQDIYITNTNTKDGNVLYRNNGDETFTDVAVDKQVHIFSTSWGANFLDYDNDLDEDLFVCLSDSFNKYNRLFQNDGSGNFTDIYAGTSGMPNDTVPCFSTAYGDYNNDGKLDIVAHSTTPYHARFWKNNINNNNNWLKVQLEGTTSNRDGVGALLEMYVNGQKIIRYVHCGDGYLSQNSFTKHFGLGTYTKADSLIIKWLGGNIDKLYNVAANQTVQIQEGSTVSTRNSTKAVSSFLIIKSYPNPLINSDFHIQIISKKYQTAELILLNELGQVFYKKEIQLQKGESQINIPASYIKAKGIIQCIITTKRERQETTFINSMDN